MTYLDFLSRKMVLAQPSGFEPGPVHPLLKPHQRDIVQWAARGGRRAIFARFGLGKTFMQLEVLRQVQWHDRGRQLVIAPLGVRQEFRADADKLGLEIRFVRRTAEVDGPGLYLTNYESVRDGRLDVNLFNAVSLDEASVLRSYGSLTFQTFLTLFSAIPYRFVATATPSPNRYKELIHYAGFLGIMDTGQALTRFFQRDSTKANNLTLYPHICPLQFDIVDRIIERYSNPGEIVFDPFAGLMTVPYRAILKGRRGRGVELNHEYFLDGVKYCRAAESEITAPSLLDFCRVENPPAPCTGLQRAAQVGAQV